MMNVQSSTSQTLIWLPLNIIGTQVSTSVVKQTICLQIIIEVLLSLLNVTVQHELLLVEHALLLSNLLVLIDTVNMAAQ